MATRNAAGISSTKAKPATTKAHTPRIATTGKCLCGAVELETDVPVFWAWHDHSQASRQFTGFN